MKSLVPALRERRGDLIKGRAGQGHGELYPDGPGSWERGFYHPDHGFLSRQESYKLFGVWNSEDLRELLSRRRNSGFEAAGDKRRRTHAS